MFTYEWTVCVVTDRELSEDAVAVIDDLKTDFVDSVNEVLDIEDEFEQENTEILQAELNAALDDLAAYFSGVDTDSEPDFAEYQVNSAPATLPEHSGSVLRVVGDSESF